MKARFAFCCLCVMVAAGLCKAQEADTPVVPLSTVKVVVGEEATAFEKYAADVLCEHAEQLTGKRYERISPSEAALGTSVLIAVGTPDGNQLIADLGVMEASGLDAGDLGPGGFVVKSAEYEDRPVLAIASYDGLGCLHGVYQYLSEVCGVWFLWNCPEPVLHYDELPTGSIDYIEKLPWEYPWDREEMKEEFLKSYEGFLDWRVQADARESAQGNPAAFRRVMRSLVRLMVGRGYERWGYGWAHTGYYRLHQYRGEEYRELVKALGSAQSRGGRVVENLASYAQAYQKYGLLTYIWEQKGGFDFGVGREPFVEVLWMQELKADALKKLGRELSREELCRAMDVSPEHLAQSEVVLEELRQLKKMFDAKNNRAETLTF